MGDKTVLISYRPRARSIAISALVGAMACTALPLSSAFAATVPQGYTDKEVARGFERPSAMTALPDGRILVLQATGVVRVLKQDLLLPAPFHTVTNADSTGERGCLGIAADPGFATNKYVYLYCTVNNGGVSNNRILRVTAEGDTATAETTILDLPAIPTGTQWHMGGGLRVGPDGKLYIGAGSQEDDRPPPELSNSLNLSNPFGKILRLNTNGSVPADNPYATTAGTDPKIYAYGLRNPYGINFSAQGIMLINEVGAGSWEEVDQGAARANYGWSDVEGPSNNPAYTNPLYAYEHLNGACAITGATFYNPSASRFPAQFRDAYFFVDFCDGQIRALPANSRIAPVAFASGLDSAVALTVSPDGALYYLNSNYFQGDGTGSVGKISYNTDQFLSGGGVNPLGGGGCAIGGDGKPDPVLPLLSLLAVGLILKRRRQSKRRQ